MKIFQPGIGGGGNDLGYFATPAALILAYPVGLPGNFAVVGSTDTIWVWDVGTGTWVNTGTPPASITFLNAGLTPYAVGGYPVGSSFPVAQSMQQMWDGLLYPVVPPGVTLIAVGSGLREKGNTAVTVTLNATTVKHTNPITSVKFYRNALLIYTVPAPNPNGGLETYTDIVPVATNTSYTCVVSDGTTTTTSNIVSFTFISAEYHGVGVQSLTPAQVALLTKVIIGNTATLTYAFTTSTQVQYFAYPDSYPALTSILDTNGFESISDWNVSVGNSITNTYGNTDTYRIYEFKNLNSNINFNFTFKQ